MSELRLSFQADTTIEKLKRLHCLRRELLRRRAKDDPDAFIEYVLRDEEGRFLRQAEIHRRLQAFLTAHRRALIVFPRWHGKTTQVIGRILWEIGNNPSLRVKIVCANDNEATKRVRTLKEIIERSKQFKEIFPNIRPVYGEWGKHSFQVCRPAELVDNTVEAYGVLSSATGSRADLLILDDVTDERNSLFSAARRREVCEAIDNKWLNLVHPKRSRIWWLGTPWHFDDAFQKRRRGAGDFSVLDCHIGPELSPIWPERWPKNELEKQKQIIGRIAFARAFHCMPVSSDIQVFKPEWFKFVERIPEDLDFYFGVDPAFSDRSTADDTAIVVIGRKGTAIYVCDAFADKGVSLQGLISVLRRYASQYKPMGIAFESVQAQSMIADEIARATGLPIRKTKTSTDKYARMSRLSTFFENGLIAFRKFSGNCGLSRLYDQLLQFPAGEHDDLCDALDFAVQASELSTIKMELW